MATAKFDAATRRMDEVDPDSPWFVSILGTPLGRAGSATPIVVIHPSSVHGRRKLVGGGFAATGRERDLDIDVRVPPPILGNGRRQRRILPVTLDGGAPNAERLSRRSRTTSLGSVRINIRVDDRGPACMRRAVLVSGGDGRSKPAKTGFGPGGGRADHARSGVVIDRRAGCEDEAGPEWRWNGPRPASPEGRVRWRQGHPIDRDGRGDWCRCSRTGVAQGSGSPSHVLHDAAIGSFRRDGGRAPSLRVDTGGARGSI